MNTLILFLIICCLIAAFSSIRPMPNGRIWLKWDTEKKLNYITRFISSLKRGGTVIKNPPLFYITELDRFYIKDNANLGYNVANVLRNLVRIHEYR
ncbi:MAG: hypothetical protein KAU58_02010 [Candidatus Omnitrophica bacterium]|nr:hypothetical protein [Candidatus Omnitrophota bacterium]